LIWAHRSSSAIRNRAAVIGLGREQSLRGITMSSPDIRAGVSLLIAALSAEGKKHHPEY